MAFLDYPGLTRFKTKLVGWINSIIGSDDMKTTATTLTGAIAEHSDQLKDIGEHDYVESVNGMKPDGNGDVKFDTIEYARQIATEKNQSSTGEFIIRTTGGSASLSDGNAWLTGIRGGRVHVGHANESLSLSVDSEKISANIDRDAFVSAVGGNSVVMTFAYTTAWDRDPEDYGITVIGDPEDGDGITVTFVAEVRGTIIQSSPASFRSTGWNLYNHANGYARVLKYDDDAMFIVGGTYTSLQFSETVDGEKSAVSVTGGKFSIPMDGYVWVNGGNATDTYILMTWSDWTNGHEGDWEAYRESVIDLSSIMANFPYGLCQVGTIRDRVNFGLQEAYSYVDRMAYSAANLAAAKASGRSYEYDQNYIYIERETPVTYTFSVNGQHIACDHGMEYFTTTKAPVYVGLLYGKNLVEYLEHDVPEQLDGYSEAIDEIHGELEELDERIVEAGTGNVKSVNAIHPDENGEVKITKVAYSDNFTSDKTQNSEGEFVIRTSGGDASISDGDAFVMRVYGNRVHEGYIPEALSMEVELAARTAPDPISAVLDEEVFEAYVPGAGTYTMTYGAAWDNDPSLYGVTVTGTPQKDDQIVIIWDGETMPYMDVIAPRTAPEPITANINRDTFVGYVDASGEITLTYTTAWDKNPALYGVSVSGEPVNGDAIVITYQKEARGTIKPATPTALKSTGWNLYNHSAGYAYLSKYSTQYGFLVGGAYTALQYSATVDGAKSAITPVDGVFTIPADGYVWVTGGNNTTTYIINQWSDWTDGPSGSFEAYSETTINLSSVMSSYFPYGLLRVGVVRDEINLNASMAISKIDRMAYSAENLAAAKASGRAFEYDTNYIYIVKASYDSYSITIDGAYTASDHGNEFFVGSDVATYLETMYGNNLKNKLERDVVTISQQTLTAAQKTQVRSNLAAASQSDVDTLYGNISTTNNSLNKLGEQINSSNAGAHNGIYRGKYLGTSVTAAQYTAIRNGTFDDLYLGDYWTIGGHNWVICDFDYYIRCGSVDVNQHHLVMMPSGNMNIPAGTALYGASGTLALLDGESATAKKWNATSGAPSTHTTAGGYKYSRMRTIIMKAANTIVINAFGSSHVLPFTELYYSPAAATDSGLASGWAWFDKDSQSDIMCKSICDLCNETMVYGQQVWGRGSAYTNVGYEIGIDKFQLAIFALNRNFANIRAGWWLRSVSSATDAAFVSAAGYATSYGSAYANGVRPRFLLVG